MAILKKPNRAYVLCILCKKRKKRKNSLFCKTCSTKGLFIKIKALGESKEYKEGWVNTGTTYHYGRLPKR